MTPLRDWRQLRSILMAGDALAAVLVYVATDYLRCRLWMQTDWPELVPGQGSTVRMHLKVLAPLALAWPLILHWHGWYAQTLRTRAGAIRSVLAAGVVLVLFMSALALLVDRELYPRAQIAALAILLPATTLALRGTTHWTGRRTRSRQRRQVLIVGVDRDAARLRRLLRSIAWGRPQVLGHLRGGWEENDGVPSAVVIGGVDELGPILDSRVVDEVFFAAPLERLPEILPLVRLCEEVGVQAYIQAESITCHSIPEVLDLHGVALLSYAPARHSPELLAIKRLLDIVVSIIGIILTAPIMLVCAAIIRATSPGPVLFRQVRCGLNGRVFRMLKFRTMGVGAEEQQADLAHLNEATGPVFKVSNDPRVTRIGRFLRRWSIDELPQLFNVLAGDMSIVGPRPPIPEEVRKYDRWQRRRLSMRPGLTCLWQIRGRHRIGFAEWMLLDLFYIDHWSLRLDFRIFFRTISSVLSGSGA